MPMIVTMLNDKQQFLKSAMSQRLEETHFSFGALYQGKVRDCYATDNKLILITTDRLSAFDRVLCSVPFKGQVLNLLTDWWYNASTHIIPNAKRAIPHPNVMIAKKCRVFPVEFVMRGYMTGSTDTSLWSQYQKGLREFDGCLLSNQLQKNAKLPRALLTPTTKSDVHDKPITLTDIIDQQLMTKDELQFVADIARALFEFGCAHAATKGLILVDTKYEFGVDDEGQIVIVDEVHTPDSSRYWLEETYQERFADGFEPESFDKEILRLWMKQQVNPYADSTLPTIPDDIILQLAKRYIELYERITDKQFDFSQPTSLPDVIEQSVLSYLGKK
jgi:phosphoribosylaminoimidazole-succinocarboxamide synthase